MRVLRDSPRRSFYLNAVDTGLWWLLNICRAIMILNTLPHGPVLITCRKWSYKMFMSGNHGLIKGTARVSIRGTLAAERDKRTWAPLLDLALNRPESGIHLQGPQWLRLIQCGMGRTADYTKNVRSIAEPKIKAPPPRTGSLSCCLQILGSKTSSLM